MNKFPNYPIKSRVHINPDGSGKRRTPISEIKDWESLFIYEIFDYKINKLKSEIPVEKKVMIDEYLVMNSGLPFKVLVSLVRGSYKPLGSDINNSLIKNIFINDVGENLSLWLMFSYSKEKGYWIETEDGGKKVFSKNNRMKTYERK